MARPPKNIWVAAGDGDLVRVQVPLSPNVPDENTYTPMHAAASYGQLQVLEYLISRGGDVNVTDSDGDTPLYTVEDIPTAQFLVDRGATIARTNNEGISPIEHLREDFEEVAAHLERLAGGPTPPTSNGTIPLPPPPPGAQQPSQHSQNAASEALTSNLMASVQEIMERAEAEGREPDEDELRAVVSRTVLQGVAQGFSMGEVDDGAREESVEKRQRGDGDS
ncbi:hypothetical protein HDZ31DRAFT_32642 [Schizophyllum fasciatum]